MIHKTAIDDMGIFHLGLIQDFFKKMRIPLSKVKVIGEYFDLDLRYKKEFAKYFPRFHKSIVENDLCPVVGTRMHFTSHSEPIPHSAVIDSFVASDSKGYPIYRCKNTNKNDRKINVGFSNRSDIYQMHEAILIQFEKI